MNTIYDTMRTTASGLLARFRQGSASLVQLSAPSPSAPAWSPGARTQATHVLDATVSGVPEALADNIRVMVTDLLVVAAVVDGVVPTLDDKIMIDGKQHSIVSYRPVPPAGTAVAWRFVVRA